MSYDAGEALVLTRLRTVSGFDATNTSRVDWGILNSGKSDRYAILKPGPFTSETARLNWNHWSTIIQVWLAYALDGTTATTLEGMLAGISSAFDGYPHLGAGANSFVLDSSLNKGSEVKEMWSGSSGPAWLMVELTVEWTEENVITMNE